MKRTLFFALAMAFAALSFIHQPSFAQQYQYKWTDKDGKTQYGDIPPPGVKATRLGSSTAPGAPAAESKPAAKDAKAAAKGPLTPAQQEAEYRRRQIDAQKSRDKDEKTAQDQEAKRANCSSAQEQVRMLESGQRIARTDAKGERYYIEDEQRTAEIAKARKAASQWCS